MAASGLTSSTNNLVLSGVYMYIDDDTSASAVIGGESLEFSADMAKLMAGKGAKVQVCEAMKSQGIAFKFDCYEITGRGLEILYGGTLVTESSKTKLRFKNLPVAPARHKFTFKAQTNAAKDLQMIFWNAKNSSFGNIQFDGQISKVPCVIKPYPLNPSDATEVIFEFVWDN